MSPFNKLITVSLFSGCGGADIGAACAGANIIFANDNNADSVATYRKYQHLFSDDEIEVKNCDIATIKTFPP